MNSPFELLFITTCNNLSYIFHLLGSIKESNRETSLLVIVVCQNDLTINTTDYETAYTRIVTINESRSLGLSAARNIALDYVASRGISYGYAMFPDDDSTYDLTFFDNWRQTGDGNKLISVRYSDRNGYFNQLKQPAGVAVASSEYAAACSVNMIISQQTIRETGFFDERLGVGASYGSGEDADYFIRANNTAPFMAYPHIYNMHPSPDYKYNRMDLRGVVRRFNNYGRGMIFTLCKNRMRGSAFMLCLRAAGGCGVSILRLRFKLAVAYGCAFFSRMALLAKLSVMNKNMNKLK